MYRVRYAIVVVYLRCCSGLERSNAIVVLDVGFQVAIVRDTHIASPDRPVKKQVHVDTSVRLSPKEVWGLAKCMLGVHWLICPDLLSLIVYMLWLRIGDKDVMRTHCHR